MNYLYLFFALFFSASLCAQERTPFLKDLVKIPFQIADEGGAFKVNWNNSAILYSTEGNKPYTFENLRIDAGDLKISLSPKKVWKEQLDISSSFILEDKNGRLLIPSETKRISNQNYELSWQDFAEEDIQMSESYNLLLKTEIFGSICEEVPDFKFSEKLPYLGAGLIGIALLVNGQLNRVQANEDYDLYQNNWLNNEDVAEGAFSDIQNQWEDYQTFSLIGGAILAIDAVVYLLGPTQKYKNEKRVYNTYCGPRSQIKIHPTFDLNTGFGYQLNLNF